MSESWTSRLLKKGMTYTQEFFPEWRGNHLLKKEGDFLVDELWEAQTFNGMLHGEVIIPETVWNRYLGRLANPEGEFQHFSIRLLPDQWLDLQLGFRTWGEATFHSEIVSLVHNTEESALVLRYRGHSLVGGNWKSRLGSWLAHRLGIVLFSRWVHRVDWGDSVHIIEDESDPTLFRIDFQKSLWNSSLADPICDEKSMLELLTIESVIGEMGRTRIQTGQRGTDVLEKWGIWVARTN